METTNFQAAFLRFVDFSQLTNWEVRANHNNVGISSQFEIISLRDVLNDLTSMRRIKLLDDIEYQEPTLSSKDNSISIRKKGKGLDFKVKKRVLIQKDDLVISKMHTQNGLFAFADQEYHSTSTFIPFAIRKNIDRNYLFILLKPTLARLYKNDTVNRETYSVDEILDLKIPLPDINTQKALVEAYQEKMAKADELEKQANQIDNDIEHYLFEQLGIEIQQTPKVKTGKLRFVNFRDLKNWSVINKQNHTLNKYQVFSFDTNNFLFVDIFRGKSPKYSKENQEAIILNQKCNRWNSIELEHGKFVERTWLDKIPNKFLTKNGDILINSTGEGTIGRASLITSKYEDLLYDSHLLLLRVNLEIINPLFFVFLFNSKYGQNQIDFLKSAQTTKQTELGINNLKKINFPLPDLPTQRQIATHIQAQKQQQKSHLTTAAALRLDALTEFEQAIFL